MCDEQAAEAHGAGDQRAGDRSACVARRLGCAAALFAQPLGIVMAWLLTDVVNREAFGWTLSFRVSPQILLEAMLMAVLAALLSTVWPSWRASRLSPSQALRSE